ncbi:MAG: NADH-quinone oxidoreductase subunit NuoK [Betaproteobacteria bacterium]|nr:NADH-quinone oxidoreductase subunit NuoK [Betaproteobacteria bacterium]
MASVLSEGLAVSALLFAIGLAGLLARRNVILVLVAIEIMLNAAGLAFIVAGARWEQADGQIMFMLILALAAAEVAVGLALVLQMDRRHATLDVDALSDLKG